MDELWHPSRETVSAYLDGTLAQEQADEVASHLEDCLTCQRLVEESDLAPNGLLSEIRLANRAGLEQTENACAQAMSAAFELVPQFDELGEIGGYKLLRELGEGAFGKVYLAQDPRMGRYVAIKLLRATRRMDPKVRSRFLREILALGRLAPNPNVVTGYQAGEENSELFLVMEYVDGQPISRLLAERTKFSAPVACEIARQVCLGLQYIDEHGLVHRDVKPQNVMLTMSGIVKLLDFSISRIKTTLVPQPEGMTETGQIIGTLDYIAPEQTFNSRDVDIRADIYSLGCMLFHMLTGRVPFPGNDVLEKLRAHRELRLPSLGPGQESLDRLISRMTAKQPGERFQRPSEVVGALAPFCENANLADLFETVIAPSPDVQPDRPIPEPAPRPPKPIDETNIGRRKALKFAAAAGIGTAVFGIGVWISRYTGAGRQHAALPAGPVGEAPIKVKFPCGIAVSDDGGKCCVLSDGQLVVFDAVSGQESSRTSLAFDTDLQQGGLTFANDAELLALATNQSATSSRLAWIRLPTLKSVRSLSFQDAAMTRVSITDDYLLTADSRGRASAWKALASEPSYQFTAASVIRALSGSSGNTPTIVTAGDDGKVRAWEAGSALSAAATLEGPTGAPAANWADVALNEHSGDVIAISRAESAIWCWSLNRATPHDSKRPISTAGGLTCAAITRDCSIAFLGTALGETLVWEIARNREIARYRQHSESVSSVAVSSNGRWACSASLGDNSACVYVLPKVPLA